MSASAISDPVRRDEAATPAAGSTALPAAHKATMRIVHCIRAPVGGVFRHVCDLAEAQSRAGHRVGLICDSSTGGTFEHAMLERTRPFLALDIHRFAMLRDMALSDVPLVWRLTGTIRSLDPDVLHAHGSKGGAYARTVGTLLRATGRRVARIYTPHGGSLHFDARSARGRIYFTAERALAAMTDAFVFVSQYEADTFSEKIGRPRRPSAVVLNGLRPEEFEPVATASNARDFLFVGELRDLKGPDVFLNALALIREMTGRAPTAFLVGEGPDKVRYRALASDLRLAGAVEFLEPMPARTAFRLANTMVVPSRKESLPYIVLEAAAAAVPLVATRVGGIPEIFGSDAGSLVPPADSAALARALTEVMGDRDAAHHRAARLQADVRKRFSIAAMAAGVEAVYRRAIAR
jgi:glycosyltransferase involved in cell wall biosynthesis